MSQRSKIRVQEKKHRKNGMREKQNNFVGSFDFHRNIWHTHVHESNCSARKNTLICQTITSPTNLHSCFGSCPTHLTITYNSKHNHSLIHTEKSLQNVSKLWSYSQYNTRRTRYHSDSDTQSNKIKSIIFGKKK